MDFGKSSSPFLTVLTVPETAVGVEDENIVFGTLGALRLETTMVDGGLAAAALGSLTGDMKELRTGFEASCVVTTLVVGRPSDALDRGVTSWVVPGCSVGGEAINVRWSCSCCCLTLALGFAFGSGFLAIIFGFLGTGSSSET